MIFVHINLVIFAIPTKEKAKNKNKYQQLQQPTWSYLPSLWEFRGWGRPHPPTGGEGELLVFLWDFELSTRSLSFVEFLIDGTRISLFSFDLNSDSKSYNSNEVEHLLLFSEIFKLLTTSFLQNSQHLIRFFFFKLQKIVTTNFPKKKTTNLSLIRFFQIANNCHD